MAALLLARVVLLDNLRAAAATTLVLGAAAPR